jgi:hypothetical protein
MNFFIHVKLTAEILLLILDIHVSHIYLQANWFGHEHNITMLGFPIHITHRSQPLEIAVFGPLKTFYNQTYDPLMVNNQRRSINDRYIGKLFIEAYN